MDTVIQKTLDFNSCLKLNFDPDPTSCETYVQQYGSAYNHHYGDDGYHPRFYLIIRKAIF